MIVLSVNKSVKLHGIQHFCSAGHEYTVSTEVKDTANNFTLVKKKGSYSSLKDEKLGYYGFTVCFDPPLCLHIRARDMRLGHLLQAPFHGMVKGGKHLLSVVKYSSIFTVQRVQITMEQVNQVASSLLLFLIRSNFLYVCSCLQSK